MEFVDEAVVVHFNGRHGSSRSRSNMDFINFETLTLGGRNKATSSVIGIVFRELRIWKEKRRK